MTERVTLALPSKGMLADATLQFLRACDLNVHKLNPRQYTASVPTLAQLDVLFQRVTDIVYKVADGTVHLGITGLDVVQEHPHDDLIVVQDNLGYGHCELVLAVPESWLDVETIGDLLDVSLDFREYKRRNLRIATKFTNLTRRFLHEQGMHHFTLVESEGALEVAPTLGYADIICDLTATGTTLRENHLKPLADGVALSSQACLIANRPALERHPLVRETTRTLLELIDAAMQGRQHYSITANMRGTSAAAVARLVAQHPVTRGLQGPTVAPIYAGNGSDGQWFTVTIIVPSRDLLAAVQHLRTAGGMQTTVMPVRYLFLEESPSFARLEALLDRPADRV
ncbi:MAG: ATP phosphoribosyltransferase [Anaerolineae bacterium]|nr:ATP phosphoribosyltransferase [Anaerolineae bacterium]